MNQAASATARSAGSAATAGCCPMFYPAFFMNTFSPQSPLLPPPNQHCFLRHTQPNQSQDSSVTPTQRQSTQTAASPQAVSTINQPQHSLDTNVANQQHTRLQPHRPLDHLIGPNVSLPTSALSLHHLLSGRPNSCIAALALASATQLQHLQQQAQHQSHQPAPINQTTVTTTNSTNTSAPNPLLQPLNANNANAIPNQVPTLYFNNYNTSQPSFDLPFTLQTAPNAHLSSNVHQTNSTNVAPTSQTSVQTQSIPSRNVAQQQQQHRPLATNTTLNSVANQPQSRDVAASTMMQPQQAPFMNQSSRNILNEESLNSLINEQVQALVLNQLLTNPHQLSAPNNVSPGQHQPTPSTNQLSSTRSTSQSGPNQNQQVVSNPVQQTQRVPLEQLSGQQRMMPTNFHQAIPNQPMRQAPSTFNQTGTNNVTQQQQPQHQQAPPQPTPLQQTTQTIPPPPFYTFQQMEQSLSLLATNPHMVNMASSFLNQLVNVYMQGGMRSEPHHTHHHAPPFHQHIHGPHHHHHAPTNQGSNQDVNMPLDSLAISESKPRGLNRAEIDSLTPYIHTDEKDSRTCVICLSKFELKSKIRPLPCNHAFHAKCVDKWLRANRTCPICRRDALKTHSAKIKRI